LEVVVHAQKKRKRNVKENVKPRAVQDAIEDDSNYALIKFYY